MRSRKGFTMIELMVVVLIVAVLAAILIPLLTARLEAARWAEGKAGAGTIATAVRAMAAELGNEPGAPTLPTTIANYVTAQDMKGKYFVIGDYSFISGPTIQPSTSTYPVLYTIQVSKPTTAGMAAYFPTVNWWQLDHTGTWTRNP